MTVRLENSRASIELTARETMLFSMLRNLAGTPQTLLRALDVLPELKAKLDQLGGFDEATRADLIGPDESGNPRRFNISNIRNDMAAFRYEWGEAATRPSETRRRLVASFPEGLDQGLLYAIQANCSFDPAFSRIGLDLLKERFFADEDLEFRRQWLPQLMGVYRRCEGVVERSVVEAGFELVDKAENEPKAEPTAAGRRVGNYLEYRLLVEWSRLDFEAAFEHVKQLEQPAEKLKVYIAMAEGRVGM